MFLASSAADTGLLGAVSLGAAPDATTARSFKNTSHRVIWMEDSSASIASGAWYPRNAASSW